MSSQQQSKSNPVKSCVLGREQRSQDGLMESCLRRRRHRAGPPTPMPPQADCPLG